MNAFNDGRNESYQVRLVAWTITYRFDVDLDERFTVFPRDRIILKCLNVINCQCIVVLSAKKSKSQNSRKDTRSFNEMRTTAIFREL